MNQIEFAKCMKKLSSFYFKDFSSDDLSDWYDLFKNIKAKVLEKAIVDIVKESKFMPNINILLDKCKSTTKLYYIEILNKMYKDGYFKNGIVELDSQHEMRNYEKSIKWIEEEIIPEFLKQDMIKYMQNEEVVIESKNSFLIED